MIYPLIYCLLPSLVIKLLFISMAAHFSFTVLAHPFLSFASYPVSELASSAESTTVEQVYRLSHASLISKNGIRQQVLLSHIFVL